MAYTCTKVRILLESEENANSMYYMYRCEKMVINFMKKKF
jgi:hypothetical protein